MKELVALLLLLHLPDGSEVLVNPNQVTSLHGPRSGETKLFTDKAKCLINLTDGKHVAVAETCPVVEKMLEDMK